MLEVVGHVERGGPSEAGLPRHRYLSSSGFSMKRVELISTAAVTMPGLEEL